MFHERRNCLQTGLPKLTKRRKMLYILGESSFNGREGEEEHRKELGKSREEPKDEALVLPACQQRGTLLVSMTIVATFKTIFDRHVNEAVLIEEKKSDFILNSKGEFNGQKMPRLTIYR